MEKGEIIDPRVLKSLRDWVCVSPSEVSDESLLSHTEGTMLRARIELSIIFADLKKEIKTKEIKKGGNKMAWMQPQRKLTIKELPSGRFTVYEDDKPIPGCPRYKERREAVLTMWAFRRQYINENPEIKHPFDPADCGGAFDGISVTSDADPGL